MRACLLLFICLFGSSIAFAESSTPEVSIHFTVQPNSIQWDRDHTFLMFVCRVVIENQTSNVLTLPNPFQDRGGLYMKVMDMNNTELASLGGSPFHVPPIRIDPGSQAVCMPYYGPVRPGTNKTLKLRLEGKLLGSSYNRQIASDTVDMVVP